MVIDPQGQTIRQPQTIAELLRRGVEHRALVTVRLPGDETPYNSALLDIDAARGRVILDELNPQDGHVRLLEARRLEVRTRLRGVETRFSSALEEVIYESNIYCYHVRLPKTLRYYQRRSHFRLRIGLAQGVAAALELPDGGSLEGRVTDLSESGVGIELDSLYGPEAGDSVPCRLTLDARSDIHCWLEIRHVDPTAEVGRLHFGGRFHELGHHHRQRLAKYIAKMQRRRLRERPAHR